MDAIADGRYSLADSVYTSAWASRMGGSQVFLKQGEIFPLEELMEAIAITSANDACVAIAEHVAGSVEGFVEMMNEKAGALGLEATTCVNVHGLDDTPEAEGNRTTAADLARTSQELLRYSEVLTWAGARIKPFRGGEFTLYTTNKLLGRFRGMDGLKTGYTQRAGFNLVATASRRSMRLISVMLGSPSEKARDRESRQLLSWGFNHFAKVPIALGGVSVGNVPLDWGHSPEVAVVAADTVVSVLSTDQRQRLKRELNLPELFQAPVLQGDSLGTMRISLDDSVLTEIRLLARSTVQRMTVWEILMSYF